MKPLSAARPGAHERVEIRLAAGTYALRETLVLGPEDGGPRGAGRAWERSGGSPGPPGRGLSPRAPTQSTVWSILRASQPSREFSPS
jgi:hypothetical protein